MEKIILFTIYLAFFFHATSAKDLASGLQEWLKKYSFGERHLLEREHNSDSKNVHKANLEHMARSALRDYHTGKLFGIAHSSANPEKPHVSEVKVEGNIINSAREMPGKQRIKRNAEKTINTTATTNIYFGQLRNLRQAIVNNTVTLHWDGPIDVDAKDIQRYVVRWQQCDLTANTYCHPLNSTNVTAAQTQFKMKVFAGDTYTFYVRAVTAYGDGRESLIRVYVPPLIHKVRRVYGNTEGRYGLQVRLYWYREYIPSSLQFEVRWHCIMGRAGFCYWNEHYGWQSQIVNTTSVTLNVTGYDTGYLFEVLVVSPEGKGKPTQYYLATDELNGIPTNFTCALATLSIHTFLVCHWLPPTDVNPAGFRHYTFSYRCDDCLWSPTQYKAIRYFYQMTVNVTVSKGARYRAWIYVQTRYGKGKSAQTTATKPVQHVGPVTMLNASLDDNIQTLVHLSWKAPSDGAVQYYMVITQCLACSSFDPIGTRVNTTNLSQNLPCGYRYLFTVRAVAKMETGAVSQVTLTVESTVAPVKNLAVEFIPGNGSRDWIRQQKDEFLLTWNPPEDVPNASIEFYEITITANKQQYVSVNRTRTTHLSIKCANLAPGQWYIFQCRCKALCGFGPNTQVFKFYPAFLSPSAQPQSSVATLPSTATSSLSSSPVKSLSTNVSPTSPAMLFSSFSLIRNEKHHFPYWTIPTAILGIIVVTIVVFFVYKNRQSRKLRSYMDFDLQESTKNATEGN